MISLPPQQFLLFFVTIQTTQCLAETIRIEGQECSYPNNTSECPHRCFKEKHYCPECETAEDAENKSKGREKYTKVNTVLEEIEAFISDGDRCNGVRTRAWDCRYSNEAWTCRPELSSTSGNDGTWICSNSHDIHTGHLFYKEIQCSSPSETPSGMSILGAVLMSIVVLVLLVVIGWYVLPGIVKIKVPSPQRSAYIEIMDN